MTYNVYASTTANFTPAAGNRIATGVGGTSYTHGGLSPSTTFYYRVAAVNSGGESTPSNQATEHRRSEHGLDAGHVWTLTWTWAGSQSIYQSWNSTFTQSGNVVTLRNASWNGQIAPGASASGIGFNANYSGANAAPAAFYRNGALCR